MDYEVGQKLWFVPRETRHYSPCAVTVEKVGRRWVHLTSGYRFEKGSRFLDGGQYASPGEVFPSKEAWETEAARREMWVSIRYRTERGYGVPDITMSQMENWSRVLTKAGL